MEGEVPAKPSVAQLAGTLRATALPMPGNMEKYPVCPHPVKIKLKSSPLIEKLQANLSLSPTVLLSPPKTTESKLEEGHPFSPGVDENSTLQLLCTEDEVPVSFEEPVGGTPLPSFNKSRVRLSFKRRLPSRLNRKSASAETKVEEDSGACFKPDSPQQNGGDSFRGASLKGTDDKADSSQTTIEPELEEDRTDNRDVPQENQGTVVSHHTGDEEEVTEEEPSEYKLGLEHLKKEETDKDRREDEVDVELLDVANKLN
ncbi:hypothetical protein DNTS_021965 [Danionella cerebrum]|uniref:FAM21/CAPZIP domain-containing protein n=1 Tax=Danionella cerebrum TaxID=2873325 RepID=A0A553QLV2_9TELE|nr:hypothetical protein DNTS_021965 [Danionella translucida]